VCACVSNNFPLKIKKESEKKREECKLIIANNFQLYKTSPHKEAEKDLNSND
jgi:hypothetical protein